MGKPWTLYCITCRTNGKKYIGITSNWTNRRYVHRSACSDQLIHRAIRKHGKENFDFEVLVIGEEWVIKEAEVKLIEKWNTMTPNGYNVNEGGSGITGLMRNNKPVVVNGVDYPSIGKAAEALGIAHGTLTHALRGGTSCNYPNPRRPYSKRRTISDAAKESMRKGQGRREASRPLDYQVEGQWFNSLKVAAKAIGINYSTLRDRFRRYRSQGNWPDGWSDNSTPRQPKPKAERANKYLVEGLEFPTLTAAAKATSQHIDALKSKFFRFTRDNAFPPGYARI